jgi:hypothetical protein
VLVAAPVVTVLVGVVTALGVVAYRAETKTRFLIRRFTA